MDNKRNVKIFNWEKRKKSEGSVLELLSVCLCILAIAVIMLAVLGCVSLIMKKSEVSQISRKYLLRMETLGYLTDADRTLMISELTQIGVKNISLGNTTLTPVGYGEKITIEVNGTVRAGIMTSAERVFQEGLFESDVQIKSKMESTAKQ